MEYSKLTICRQDVIVVSDTDSESNNVNLHKKKKRKRKPQCIRNVKLTTMTINRVVPFCYRQRCRDAQQSHRQTSVNRKYRPREKVPALTTCKKRHVQTKNTPCKSNKNYDMNGLFNRKLYSPITVASSSDTYEDISSCNLNFVSSDSDELEDLIYLTRKRMKSDSGNFDSFPIRKSVCAPTTKDDYQNISSDDAFDNSIHSMDTILLCHKDTMTPGVTSSQHCEVHEENNNIDPVILCRDHELQNDTDLLQQKITTLTNVADKLSPLYEISGKVFMEHYLNTSFI